MGDDVENVEDLRICFNCVGEEFLKNQIKQEGENRECRYCGHEAESLTLGNISDRVEAAFDAHFSRTASGPDGYEYALSRDPESTYEWERTGSPTAEAIEYAADIPPEAASDIQTILADRHFDFDAAAMGEETPFGDEVCYEEIMPGDGEWQEEWHSFQQSLKTEARFFSRTAALKLGALFDDLEEMRTRGGRSLIVPIGPETSLSHLFRARVFQSDLKLERALERPDRELAAPPAALAAAGRMNAKGISTFYGATTSEVALNEVRPPVGSQVVVARFMVKRHLRLLDLNALAEVHVLGSIFDPKYARELGRMMFLRGLRDRIARPVMPEDQDFEYLPTQAIADYLATEGKAPLDGIMFPSVQAGGNGLNVVLFHKASRCEGIDVPKGTKFTTSSSHQTDEGWEREYYVIETVPPPKPKDATDAKSPLVGLFRPPDWEEVRSGDYREPTLSIDIGSIEVRIIEAVEFKTDDHRVGRHRSVGGEAPF
jgi:hypothetical protein